METKLEIETDVPVPKYVPSGNNQGRPSRYPWAEMQPGDSVLIPADYASVKAVRASLHGHKRNHGGHYVTRKMDDGIRVWRLE